MYVLHLCKTLRYRAVPTKTYLLNKYQINMGISYFRGIWVLSGMNILVPYHITIVLLPSNSFQIPFRLYCLYLKSFSKPNLFYLTHLICIVCNACPCQCPRWRNGIYVFIHSYRCCEVVWFQLQENNINLILSFLFPTNYDFG